MRKTVMLGIIPARAGSKGIPKKNIRPLNGKPLLAYSIDAAKKSRLLNDCLVSTESEEFAAVARKWGGNVPFLRPPHLAKDLTPTWPVLEYTLKKYEAMTGKHFTHIVLLQPTSPLRTAEDIDRAIRLVQNSLRDRSLISCRDTTGCHPRIMHKDEKGKIVPFVKLKKEGAPRQSFETVYLRNGAIYIMPRDVLLKQNKMIGDDPIVMVMPKWQLINIDSPDDFALTELVLNNKKKFAHIK